MSTLEIFQHDGAELRIDIIDDNPWFVAADVAAMLGYSEASAITRTLDEDEKGLLIVQTPGGPQPMAVISEAGLYSAIMRSRVEKAKEFRRWVTHEVLPAIRRTGTYNATPVLPQSYAEALRELAATVERSAELEAANAELTPRAEAWDELASADGDYAVADAAKILARAGVQTGPQRLFEQLSGMRWIHRAHDGKWRAYASKVDLGYLTEKPQSHYHPRTSELVLDAPQVRVTVRGLERLRVRLGSIEVAA